MTQVFANAARGELSAAINTTDTTISIVSGGTLFPVADTGTATPDTGALAWFKAVIQDDTGFEIVLVRSHASGATTFTNVQRAQDGTTARSFAAGAIMGIRPLASDADGWTNQRVLKSGDTMTGPLVVPAGASGSQVPRMSEVQALLTPLAPKASPTFTGTPVGPTPATTDDSAQLATTAFVYNVVQDVVGLGGTTPNKALFNLNSAALGSFISVNGTGADEATYNWPTSGRAAGSAVFYNVATFGTTDRTTQLAMYPFADAAQNRVWIRHKHDATWSTWVELARTASPTFTGTAVANLLQPTSLQEKRVAMAANNIDLSTGNVFTKTISGATTLTVSNVPAAGLVGAFLLDMTNGGSATITWWSGVKWAGGSAPTFTSAGRDLLGFVTHDGGTTWTGTVIAKDAK